MPLRIPHLQSRWAKAALACAAVLALVIALFDWNGLRYPIERYLANKSGREVRIGALNVSFGRSLQPTVHLRDVYVANASWAAKQPLIKAGEVTFTVSLTSLWERRPLISQLVLANAEIDLERQADGTRNWRLIQPDDRGPGKVKVLALDARRTTLRFVNRAIDFELVASSEPIEPQDNAASGDRLTKRIGFKGAYQGARFAGAALTSDALTFRQSGRSFAVRGEMTSGKTRFDFDGTMADVFDIGPIAGNMRLAGDSLSNVHPFLRIKPPASRPYAFEARLTQANKVWSFTKLAAKIGASTLAGEATYDRSSDKPRIVAKLESVSARLEDLAPLVGVRYPAKGVSTHGTASQEDDASASRLLPARRMHFETLRTLDAEVTMNARRLHVDAVPLIESGRVSATLANGVLELKPLTVGVAGGSVAGSISFDARTDMPQARVNLEARDVRLGRLVASTARDAPISGAIRARAALHGSGPSLAALFATATGSLAADVDRARISNTLDAKLALDIGKLIAAKVRGDRDLTIHCGTVAFDFDRGAGTSRTIAFDTEQTHVDGAGTIDFKAEKLDVSFVPQPKDPSLFRRNGSLRLQGPIRKPRLSVERANGASSTALAGDRQNVSSACQRGRS